MKNELLGKITLGVSVLFFLSNPMWANAAIVKKDRGLKHDFQKEMQVQSSSERMKVSLKCLSKASERFKAADEQVVEYPDSMVSYTAAGKKVYITQYEYDANNRLVHKVETALLDDETWAVVSDQKMEYDDEGRAVYNEYYALNENGVWVGTAKIRVKYDQYNNQVYKEQFKWDEKANDWTNNMKEISEYRPDGQPVYEEGYYWSGSGWKGSFREAYTYNELGGVVKYEDLEWEDGKWVDSFYSISEYDTEKPKNIIVKTEYEKDYDTEEMAATAKALYSYNEKDEYILILWKAWEDGEWVDGEKYQYEYTNGKNTKEEGFSWDGESWISGKKWEGSFDEEGRQLTSLFYYPNSTTGELELSSKSTFAFDGNGNKILSQLESVPVDGSTTDLIMMQKAVWEYDQESRLTLYESYAYNYLTGFGGDKKEVVEYTGHGDDQLLYVSYKWDTNAKDWVNDMKEAFSYDSNNLATECIRSYGGTKIDEWVESEKYDFLYNKDLNMDRQNYSVKDKNGNWVMQQYLLYYYPSTVNVATIEKSGLDIFAIGNNLYVSGIETGTHILIYDLSGRLVKSILSPGETLSMSLMQGMYLVKAGEYTVKVAIK